MLRLNLRYSGINILRSETPVLARTCLNTLYGYGEILYMGLIVDFILLSAGFTST